MGLFDNLFLDANTVVTINDGMDHSKDTIKPLPVIPPPGATGDDGKDPNKDDSLVTLFDDGKKEEEENAEKLLDPKPPEDIAQEIGHDSAQMDLTDGAPNIDIGGDFSFDIGGDMSSGETLAVEENAGNDTIITDTQDTLGAETLPVISDDGTPADSALFSLLNTDTQSNENSGIIEPSSQEGAISTEATTLSEPSVEPEFSALFSMDEEKKDETLPGVDPTALDAASESAPGGEALIADILTPTDGATPNASVESLVGVSALTNLMKAPKLSDKLSQFLDELETMDTTDQGEKDHKRQQIEVFETRIREIQAQADASIQALRLQIQALQEEIQAMDHEKDHIKKVIETLQKEAVMI